jgi:membrane protease YdiL (CAAX protease family)
MIEEISRLFVLEGRLRSGWRVGLYLICYVVGLLVIQTPIAILYVGYLMLQGVGDVSDVLAAVQPDRLPLWFYLLLKLAEVAMLLPLTYAFRRLLDRRDWTSLGFRRGRGWMLDLLLGLALGGVQMLVIFGIEWAGGWLSVALLDGAMLARGMAAGGMAAVLFVLVAVGEELVFRGYLLVNLRDGIGPVLALALTSLLFSLFHIINPNLNPVAVGNIALAGAVMGCGWLVTGNLWLPLAYHFSWNFFQGPILALPVSGVRYGGLLAVADRGIEPLATGAAFGPEGGLVGTLALLSAFPVFWLWGRWRQSRGESRTWRMNGE